MRYLFKLIASILMLSCLALLSGLVPAIPASLAAPVAQNPAQAGLVVRFGDGRVEKACVNLGATGEMTGEQALRASGLTTIVAFDPGAGSAVCKIEQVGCNYPAEGCFCQCTLAPGQQCRYWAYYQWNNNDWVFSQGGSSSRILRDGDVDGWSWGPGGIGLGVEPPAVPFEEICVPPATMYLPLVLR
ncbi:hypothetical protein EYB53_013000 [Candidatus Chloroploca sp. M-50]|uniref:Uncharacterized protein n=1 Tax=Candidatus Chloroploca mongolica TaxID=2528176 RepID=A0ABS4DAZ9_9CHLR|nr:hypothetical protein [Candidatus Chloroploca mongolica]MBP1466626.1 hypothetical protein [Candidatus Chloroploca mongolica]